MPWAPESTSGTASCDYGGLVSSAITLTALRGASIGVVAWVDPRHHENGAGQVRVRGVLPLVAADEPVLALPYESADAARSLGAASEALLIIRDARGTSAAYRPLTLRCRPRLVEDREGDVFVQHLLDQELRHYPPSRLLADSMVLRREHWWWLPRLMVHLEVLAEDTPLPRADERDHLLVVGTSPPEGAHHLAVGSARLRALPAASDFPRIEVTEGAPGPGPAVLHGQDASFPDLERWGRWSWRGHWDGVDLKVTDAPTQIGLPPTPGLLTRWRRQRVLHRACFAGLSSVG